MKVSIITATYNSEKTIADTLECIRHQDYPMIEHIIVDGLSQDRTLEIIHSFAHVSTLVSEKDEGLYDAMNKGISRASGDIIGILNSDDMYVDNTVISTVAEVFKNEKVDACYADLQYVQAMDGSKVVRTWKSGPVTKRSFHYGWMPPHPTFFVRRSVYQKVGLFNTKLKTAADYEMMLRILVKYHLLAEYIPRVLVKMRTGGMSNASLFHRMRANREDRLAWKLNGLKPYFFTLYLKPIRKISQFIIK
jgi:glycosyltransferase involved in cell wall biosynthesis